MAEANVISLHAQGYTSVPVDTWRTDWSAAAYAEVTIACRATKKYSNLDYVGIETVQNQIDITEMTHFHLHVWSPDFTLFRVKLVDLGADGAYGGGDDTEHEIAFQDLPKSQWVSLDIPLTDFVNLKGRKNIAQLIFSGLPTGAFTVYIDNVFFYTTATNVNEPMAQDKIRVYPNPVRSGSLVYLGLEARQVDIFDLTGKMIKSKVNTSSISTEGMIRGVYFMRIHSGNGAIQVNKLMVN